MIFNLRFLVIFNQDFPQLDFLPVVFKALEAEGWFGLSLGWKEEFEIGLLLLLERVQLTLLKGDVAVQGGEESADGFLFGEGGDDKI